MHQRPASDRRLRLPSSVAGADFWLFLLAAAFLLVMIVRTAWLSDDAYITLRTIDNWRQGYGLRWNIAERVQTYTHPLWMFSVAGGWAITGEPYFSTMILSILCASGAATLLAARYRPWLTGAAVLILLSTSAAFIDYSTSGLETPLAYLLIAAFVAAYWTPQLSPRRAFACACIGSLLAVNRLDSILLVAPALAHIAWRGGRQSVLHFTAGFLPLVAWELFSIVYYGTPFPNTAYAKLAHGIPQHEITSQGFAYLMNSWREDRVTLLTISAALVLSAWRPRPKVASVALGLLLYLAYVVRVGGDFMSGRFLAPALFAAAAVIAEHPSGRRGRTIAAAAMILLGLVHLPQAREAAWPTGPPPPVESLIDSSGIADERRIYARETGLLTAVRRRSAPTTAWEMTGRQMRDLGVSVMTRDSVGMFAYGAGPSVHIIDRLALCDPLLARLPAQREWRIGHFYRDLPGGYVELLRGKVDRLQNPRLDEYYRAIRLVTRGRLWSRERWKAILLLWRNPIFEPRDP